MSDQDKGRGFGPRDYTGSNEAGGHPRSGAGSGGTELPQGWGGTRYGAESEGARQAAYFMEDPRQVRARGRMPRNYRRSDERVREDICERLAADARIDATEVTVEVRGGRVMLEGTVPERRMKYLIEDTAAACLGANDVENRIAVARREQSPEIADARRPGGFSGTDSAAGGPPVASDATAAGRRDVASDRAR